MPATKHFLVYLQQMMLRAVFFIFVDVWWGFWGGRVRVSQIYVYIGERNWNPCLPRDWISPSTAFIGLCFRQWTTREIRKVLYLATSQHTQPEFYFRLAGATCSSRPIIDIEYGYDIYHCLSYDISGYSVMIMNYCIWGPWKIFSSSECFRECMCVFGSSNLEL